MRKDRQERKRAYTDDKEHSCKDSCGHDVQHCQKWASHCPPDRHAHKEMADSLLYYRGSFYKWLSDLASVLLLGNVKLCFVDC